MDIAELKQKSVAELHQLAEQRNITNYSGLRKQDLIFRIEQSLLDQVQGRLEDLPRVGLLRLWDGDDVDRLGVCTFTIEGMEHSLAAAALSAEHGIGVRHGCFCAHPLLKNLLGIDDATDALEIQSMFFCKRGIPACHAFNLNSRISWRHFYIVNVAGVSRNPV